jgi:tetratricopeptide (TPR) repeat protein
MSTRQPADSLAALRELLSKADHFGSLREVAETLVPERRHTLLRRAAVPVVFDEPMAREILAANLPGTGTKAPDGDVAWLLAHADIERLGGGEPLYRMRAAARTERLERWFAPNDRSPAYEDVVNGIGLSQAIVDRLTTDDGAVRAGWQIEHLYHLVMANPAAAMRRLETLYRAADADFDVPSCYRVLQAIGGQRALLVRHRDQRDQPAERRQAITRLLETHDTLQQYYEARCAFAGDLAKSAHALERQFMRDEWNRIQRINTTSGSSINTPEREWIIDLTAQGGMGKTIFLQWLAARRCVPNRVPYARIDFDFTDPTVLPEAPWLVLVRLAQQLNSQIAGRPFSGFIEKYDEYASIARDLAVEGRAAHTGEFLDVTGEQRLARQVTDDFADTLRETVGGAVVVVLDTLEDVIRRRTTNLLAVITCLSKVHDAYPNLRLVLAGRFDLRDDSKLKGFAAAFGTATRSVKLERFDFDESVRYLVSVRGLPDNDAVRAMADCSRGLPFALSLYADEWQLGGAMTAEEVRASPNPELKYLVNRVLRRIEASDQALCWLLRYGVVPRQLTKSFAHDVLLPELEAALGGAGTPLDDPTRDTSVLHPYYVEQQASSAPASVDLDDLWARLEAYASTLSFVRADVDRDTVVFHEDAVRPMRRELQRQPVFQRLQARAAEYYAQLAREVARQDSGRWVRATRAMLFHLFQLGGPQAERAWRRALKAATARRDVRLVFEVATELTQPEYLDDDRRSIVRDDGTPIVAPAVLRDALVAKAQAALQLGASVSNAAADVDWWAEAERALDDLMALERREPALEMNRSTVAVMRAQVDARYGKSDEALDRLDRVRATMISLADQFELSVALGGVLATRESPEAINRLTDAIKLGEELESVEPHRIIELRQQLATQCALHDRYDLAIEQLVIVRNRLRRGSIDRSQATGRLAEVLIASDEPRQAVGAARSAIADCNAALGQPAHKLTSDERAAWLALRAELEVLEARALCANGEPEQALAKADAALASATQLTELQPATTTSDMLAAVARARARSARGVILATRGRHGPALDDLETARQVWAQGVKRVEQSATDLCRKVTLLLYRVGNLKMAEQHLSEAERITLPTRGESWTALRVGAARLDGARGHAADALRRLEASYPPQEPRIPRLDVRVAVAALSMSEHAGYAGMLTGAIERITPPGAARHALSQALPDYAPLAPLLGLGDAGRRIAELIGVRCDQAATRQKSLSAWARLERARIAYVLGATDDARRWLASVTATALSRAPAPTIAFAHYLECEMRVPDAARNTRDARRRLIDDPGDARMLAGIVAYREASRLVAAGDRDQARTLAKTAASLLNSPGESVNVWAAACDGLLAELSTNEDDRKHYLAEAIARYDALDQDGAAAELRQRRGPQTFEETVSRERPPLVLRVSVDGTDLSGELSADRDGAIAERFSLSGTSSGTLEHLRSDLEAARAQAIPYQLSRLLADEWSSAIRDLGALFGPRAFWQSSLGSDRNANVDVRLDIQSPIVDALPLECFSDRGDEPNFLSLDKRVGTLYRSVRVADARRIHATWVQRALSEIVGTRIFADGIEGPQTRGAISAFQTSIGVTPTGEADGVTSALLFDHLRRLHNGDARLRALIVAAAPDLARTTGAEEEAAAERLARIYEEAGFETVVREGVTVADLRELCTEFRPEVIHVRAPLRESASLGGIVLDARASGMSESAASARGDALTPSGVTRALGQTRWPDRPIVVLDPSRGRGRTQAMHQMLLRNGFAADLFRQGTTVAVLGVGLGEPDQHARITRTIAESFAHGRSLSDLVADLRENPPGGRIRPVDMTFETMLPTVGVALWAFDPKLVYLTPPVPSRR